MAELPPPPLERSLGDILAEALSFPPPSDECGEWAVIDAAAELIACHYRLDSDEGYAVICELEAEFHGQNGVERFGSLLERPWGFSTLGLRVAQRLLGETEADCLPLIHMSYH